MWVSVSSQFAQLRMGVHLDYSSVMDQNLCRRPMPRPKFGRSRPTAAAAAPATFRLVHLQVVGREQMAIAADMGYGQGLEESLHGEAHQFSFGCSKAGPRYHFLINNLEEAPKQLRNSGARRPTSAESNQRWIVIRASLSGKPQSMTISAAFAWRALNSSSTILRTLSRPQRASWKRTSVVC
jgi:hypothetical protein